MGIRIIPSQTSIDFLGKKWGAFVLSIILITASIFLVATRGLNFGIDFTGGILIEAGFPEVPEFTPLRELLSDKISGDISLQGLDDPKNVLIRVGDTSDNQEDRLKAIISIKEALANYGEIDYRKVDYVGPKVGAELIFDGAMALSLALVAILIYIWIRFEWQYGAGAIAALFHDTILTLGFFSLTQLEFNLSSIAAILTIIGYSINDSVVIFDRIRDNVRKFKQLAMDSLLNNSINQNLNRTLITSLTTAIALLALVIFGGNAIESFSQAALFGVIVGTYSSIYVAAPSLIYLNLRRSEINDNKAPTV